MVGTNVREKEQARWLWGAALLCFGLLVGYAVGAFGNRLMAPLAAPAGNLLDIVITLLAIAAASMLYGVVSDRRAATRARRLRVELDRIYTAEPELFDSIRVRATNLPTTNRSRER